MPPCSYQRYSTCVVCDVDYIARNWSGPVSAYCSVKCKNQVRAERERNRRRQKRSTRACANPFCSNRFEAAPGSKKETCGKDCMYVVQEWRRGGTGALHSAAINKGMLTASRVYLRPCKNCGAVTATRARARRSAMCAPCRDRWTKAHNTRKNHARRTTGRAMSVHEIAARDGTRCHICRKRVDMSLSGKAKWGPTVEHIIPVSLGGTNDPSNTVLAHRHCNVSRGNRRASQMLLVA